MANREDDATLIDINLQREIESLVSQEPSSVLDATLTPMWNTIDAPTLVRWSILAAIFVAAYMYWVDFLSTPSH